MTSDPLALFAGVADALRRGEWRSAARLCDPASLTSFKRYLVEQFEPTHAARELTVENYMRHDPEMPRAVAEYHVAQINRARDPAEHLANELAGISSVSELRALSALDVFAAWLRAHSPQHQVERLVARGQIPQEAAAGIADLPGFGFDHAALGAVADGENLSHIVFRQEFRGSSSDPEKEAAAWMGRLSPEEQALARDLAGREHPQVATCRRQPGGEWRMLAGHGFLGLGGFGVGVGLDDLEPSGDATGE